MKRIIISLLCLSTLFISVPVAADAVSSSTEVINKHGSETYMGTYASWNKSWDEDNFTEVTDEDIDTDEDLIIKGGTVGNVTVSDGSGLTISGGTMEDVSCEGNIEMSGGKANSLQSDEDITVSGGKVSEDVDADNSVTLDGGLSVGGGVSAEDVTVEATDSSGKTAVEENISFTGEMILEGSYYSIGEIDGQDSGTLELADSAGTLPDLMNVTGLSLTADSRISTSDSFDINSLSISGGSEFIAGSTVNVGTVAGPGALAFSAGKLTIGEGISDSPVFDLSGTAAVGVMAFKADSGSVSTDEPVIFGYGLSKDSSSDYYDYFTLTSPTGSGVTLNSSSITVPAGSAVTVAATISPSLSQLPDGTQLCWKLLDPNSKFTITSSASAYTCSVYFPSSSDSTVYRATLAAYLADSSGNVLTDYRSALCTITSSPASSAAASSGISLDTRTVKIPVGHKYYVLAITNANTPPLQISYNSAIAVTGKASAYSYQGRTGWLYPVTAIARGGVTINIGGQTFVATVE